MPDQQRDIAPRAFALACRVLRLCDPLLRGGGVAALAARQLAKAGTSSGANLEECKGAQSRPDFIAKTFIALKESRESYYWLRLMVATVTPLPADAVPLRDEAGELVAILTAIAKNARRGDAGDGRN